MTTSPTLYITSKYQLQGSLELLDFHPVYCVADRPPNRDYNEELAKTPAGITVYFDLLKGGSDSAWTVVKKNIAPTETKVATPGGGEG